MTKPPPQSKLTRANVVGKALLKIGVAQTKGAFKRKLGSQSPYAQKTHEEIADIIFEAMGELRGVSVKIAQQMALGMPFLSPVYLERIAHSFNAIPPLNRPLIRKLIKQELGGYPDEIFEEFEGEAFAAASLGQVHRGWHNGEPIALKVQYPGIKQTITTDLSLLHFALKRFAKGNNVDHLITEIEGRLYEEVEYELEADNYEFFGANMKMEGIIIPKVYRQFTTTKILATEYLKGQSLDEYLTTNPTQEEKNRYGQLIFDSFFHTLYTLKSIHADPNPGNFLFMEDGRLAMVDFGCIKRVEGEFLAGYNALHLDLIEGVSDEDIIEHYVNFGMIARDSEANMLEFYREVIKPLDRLYIEPLMGESYDFALHNDFSKRGFETIFEVHRKQYHSVHQVNQEYLFLDRTLLGYYAIFERLGARIETEFVKNIMRKYWSER